jgi:hypothetical protein
VSGRFFFKNLENLLDKIEHKIREQDKRRYAKRKAMQLAKEQADREEFLTKQTAMQS